MTNREQLEQQLLEIEILVIIAEYEAMLAEIGQ